MFEAAHALAMAVSSAGSWSILRMAPESTFALIPRSCSRTSRRAPSVDFWEGTRLSASWVPLRARVRGFAIPSSTFHRYLLTRREERGEIRRGVTFIRELVPRVDCRCRAGRLQRTLVRAHSSDVHRGGPYSPPRIDGRPLAATVSSGGRANRAVCVPRRVRSLLCDRALLGYTRQRTAAPRDEVQHPRWNVCLRAALHGDISLTSRVSSSHG